MYNREGFVNECRINYNIASRAGGGVMNDAGGGVMNDAILNNCILSGNSMSRKSGLGRGSGACNTGLLNNCLIYNNSSTSGGAVFGYGDEDPKLRNCTIFDNNGGGLKNDSACNSIIYGNSGFNHTNATLNVCYTDDPHFVDASSTNFQLRADSPCIDAGLNVLAPTNATPYDLAGDNRILYGTVDIGAYEYRDTNLYYIAANAGEHGSVSPTETNVVRGSNIQFALEPEQYYEATEILTNGSDTGISAATNYTWINIQDDGTLNVSFSAQMTDSDVPHWWLAEYGWTNDFELAASADQDGDKLSTKLEYDNNTEPENSNTDGDQFNDGIEVNAGADPLHDDSQVYGAILDNSALFDLYTTNNVSDLSLGETMIEISGGQIRVLLQMKSSSNIMDEPWSDEGNPIEWTLPVSGDKKYFRFHGSGAE